MLWEDDWKTKAYLCYLLVQFFIFMHSTSGAVTQTTNRSFTAFTRRGWRYKGWKRLSVAFYHAIIQNVYLSKGSKLSKSILAGCIKRRCVYSYEALIDSNYQVYVVMSSSLYTLLHIISALDIYSSLLTCHLFLPWNVTHRNRIPLSSWFQAVKWY